LKENFNQHKVCKYGEFIYNTNDMYVGKSLELYGEYCDEEARILEDICRDGDIVVEVGANIGSHTVSLAKKVGLSGKVFAFEPQRVVFQTLCGNLAINSISNTFAYQYGVGDENTTAKIEAIDYSEIGNFGGVSLKKESSQNKEMESIQVVRLDDFLHPNSIRLLKIDVEGMEINVLRGASNLIKKHKPIIYIENDRLEKSKELIEYLWSLDYELYWHLPHLFNPNNFFAKKENLLGNFVSVNMLCIEKTAKTKVEKFVKVEDSSFHPMNKKQQ
jgi:FkbM family methyltransferase